MPSRLLRRTPLLALSLLATTLPAGCESRHEGTRLPELARSSALPLRFQDPGWPETRASVREDGRPILAQDAEEILSRPFVPPPGARLAGSVALRNASAPEGDAARRDEGRRDGEAGSSGGAEVVLRLEDERGVSRTAGTIALAEAVPGAWTPYRFDLTPPGPGPLRLRVRLPADATLRERILLAVPRLEVPPTPLPGRPVVLICADALRADHLSCYGYARPTSPHLDALAREGIRVAAAYSASTWTLPSVASLFTGLHPGGHGAVFRDRALAAAIPTLAERLREAGYRTAGVVSGSFTAPRFGLARGFERWIDWLFGSEDLADANHRNLAPVVTDTALALLEELQGSLFFLFLHYFDPHRDYTPPPPWDTRFDPDYRGTMTGEVGLGANRERFHSGMPPRDLQHVEALYDGEIGFMDEHIGRLLEALPRDAIVLFTADHGEAFFEHGFAGHGPGYPPYEELARVPLLWRLPEGFPAGRTLPGPVSLVDVVPTLADLLALPPPSRGPALEGRSLLADLLGAGEPGPPRREAGRPDPGAGGPPARALVEVYPWDRPRNGIPGAARGHVPPTHAAFRSGSWMWIRGRASGRGAPAWEDQLFDLRVDPAQRRNLARDAPEVLSSLREKRITLEKDWTRSREGFDRLGAPIELTPEEADAMRGLGYGKGRP